MNPISPLLSNIFQGDNAATSHLSEKLDQRAAAVSAGGNWRESIVDLATLIGMDSSLASRRQLATELEFFGDFNDTAMMNTFLLNRIIMTIVEKHALSVASKLDQLAANRIVELDWRDSIVDLMKLFGMRSRLTRRERLATKLGYTGELDPDGTMNMWLHTRLMLLIVDRGGSLPDDLAPPPERTSKQRVEALCSSLKTKDVLVPALVALWQRRKSREPGRNDFERRLFSNFDSLDAEEQEGLGRAFDGYRAFRSGGDGDCLFDDSLAEAVRNGPPEKKDFAAAIFRQGLALTAKQDFAEATGKAAPGQVRPWRKGINFEGGLGPEEPWPWIHSIHIDHEGHFFGNRESLRPVPPAQTFEFKEWQFEKTCKFIHTQDGELAVQKCEIRKVEQISPPGDMQFPILRECEGGTNYTSVDDECIRIPTSLAGGHIYLNGFNFIAEHVDVHLQSLEVPERKATIKERTVFGSPVPARNEQGKAIVDISVKDRVAVPIPTFLPEGADSPFPPGLYEIWISVSDPSAPPGTPARESNRLVLRIEPDPSTQFQLDCEGGRCINETPGGGDDEIWWDVWLGHLVPNEQPISRNTPIRATIDHVRVNPEPWKDVDDGEPVESPHLLMPPRKFDRGGILIVSIAGFEVDSESAAREHLQGFSNAFNTMITNLATASIGTLQEDIGLTFEGIPEGFFPGASGGSGIIGAASLLHGGYWQMAAMAAALVLSVSSIWAAWAPADMIALDMFPLDPKEAWDRTDAAKPLPPDAIRHFASGFDNTDVGIKATDRALTKVKVSETEGTWRHEIQYDTRHDGDVFSSYVLRLRLTRSQFVQG